MSAKNARLLSAPTCRSPFLPPWPWLPWQPAQARANTRAPLSLFALLAPAGAKEGWHWTFLRGADGPSLRDDAQQLRIGNNGEEHWVDKRRRRAKLTLGAVAAGTVRCVQDAEIRDLVRRHRTVGGIGPAGKV